MISYELTTCILSSNNNAKKAFKTIPNNTNITLHSDQGWQYQMRQYQQLLKERNKTKHVKRAIV
jgi:transposase InsO family protein